MKPKALAICGLLFAACTKQESFDSSLAEPAIDSGTWSISGQIFHKTAAAWGVKDSLQCLTVVQDSATTLWLYFKNRPAVTSQSRTYLIADKPTNDSEVLIVAHLGDCCGFAASQRKDVDRYLRVRSQDGTLRFTTSDIALHKSAVPNSYEVSCSINLTE